MPLIFLHPMAGVWVLGLAQYNLPNCLTTPAAYFTEFQTMPSLVNSDIFFVDLQTKKGSKPNSVRIPPEKVSSLTCHDS